MVHVKSKEGRKWPQFLAAATASIANFTTGLNLGWPTPFLPKLLSDEYPFDVTNDEASYITIISSLGNIVGGFLGTILIDQIGRRKTILLVTVPQIICFTMIFLSYNAVELLYVGRFIGGISEGACLSVIPLYIAEMAEPEIRGILGTMTAIAFMTGMVFLNVLGYYASIKTTAAISLVFPVVFLIAFWKMPESPYYLLMKNRKKEAVEALIFFRRKHDVTTEIDKLTTDIQRQMEESGTYKDLFTIKSNRKALILMVGARVAQQFTGCSAFMLYAQLLLRDAADALEPVVGSSIILMVQLSVVVSASFFVDRCGRRPLLIASSVACFVNLTIQAIFYSLKEYTLVDVSVINWFPLVMMVLFIILFTMGGGVVPNVLQSEIFSSSIKPKAVSLVNVVFALSMMGTTKFYQAANDGLGLPVPFYFFAVSTFLGTIFYYYCVPETKGKTLEEIQQILKGNENVKSNK